MCAPNSHKYDHSGSKSTTVLKTNRGRANALLTPPRCGSLAISGVSSRVALYATVVFFLSSTLLISVILVVFPDSSNSGPRRTPKFLLLVSDYRARHSRRGLSQQGPAVAAQQASALVTALGPSPTVARSGSYPSVALSLVLSCVPILLRGAKRWLELRKCQYM